MNDPQQVTFQPGESHHNICIIIIDDDIREGNEKFRLLSSIPYSVRALGVWSGYPYYADVVLTGTQNFTYSHVYVLNTTTIVIINASIFDNICNIHFLDALFL